MRDGEGVLGAERRRLFAVGGDGVCLLLYLLEKQMQMAVGSGRDASLDIYLSPSIVGAISRRKISKFTNGPINKLPLKGRACDPCDRLLAVGGGKMWNHTVMYSTVFSVFPGVASDRGSQSWGGIGEGQVAVQRGLAQ